MKLFIKSFGSQISEFSVDANHWWDSFAWVMFHFGLNQLGMYMHLILYELRSKKMPVTSFVDFHFAILFSQIDENQME